jgi:UDP-glucose 4-epimerase
VENVARILVDAAVRRLSEPRPVNLAFGFRTSINEVLDMLQEIAQREVGREYGEPRRGDIRDSHAFSARLHELFPDVHHVALRDGLERTFAWYRDRHES